MPNRTKAHLLFMACFGLAGWSTLVLATYIPGLDPVAAHGPRVVPFTLFFLVVVCVRSLAFEALPDVVISLDSAFYIAAVICLGSVPTGRLVALALTLDALLRLLGAEGATRRAGEHRFESVMFAFYFGGMTGGLVIAVGRLFRIDEHSLVGRPDAEGRILGLVLALGGTLLVLHYLIQGLRLSLAGHKGGAFLRRMALPGMFAEASLLPLAAVVVILFRPGQPLGLVLLGLTYVLVNFIFNRLSHASASLRQRVSELETLNRTARALSATLQHSDVVEAIGRETLAAIPEAEVLALSHHEGEGFAVDYLDREHGKFERVLTRGAEGASAWVAERRQALYVPDLPRSDFAVGDSGMRSWLGAPMITYDEVSGVLSVQSRERDAFSPDQERLLEAIGAQAAVALQNARLYELATVDGLTGLYVRRYFDARLREELERARRFHTPFSLILLDIDDFKVLNDTFGHQLGDRVLKEIARAVKRNMRGVDIAARYGGEEFAFILPRTAIVDAHAVAERIRQDLAEARVHSGGKVLRVTASLGVACYPDSGKGGVAALVRRADVALYRAKSTGKNRVELYWGSDAAAEGEPSRSAQE